MRAAVTDSHSLWLGFSLHFQRRLFLSSSPVLQRFLRRVEELRSPAEQVEPLSLHPACERSLVLSFDFLRKNPFSPSFSFAPLSACLALALRATAVLN